MLRPTLALVAGLCCAIAAAEDFTPQPPVPLQGFSGSTIKGTAAKGSVITIETYARATDDDIKKVRIIGEKDVVDVIGVSLQKQDSIIGTGKTGARPIKSPPKLIITCLAKKPGAATLTITPIRSDGKPDSDLKVELTVNK